MEDCLGEALHVLRNHAVGSGLSADMHSLLSAAGGAAGLNSLSQSFSLPSRVPGMVPNHHEESAGLTPTSALLHVQHTTTQAPTSSQPEGFSSKSRAHVTQKIIVHGSFSNGNREAGNQNSSTECNPNTCVSFIDFKKNCV